MANREPLQDSDVTRCIKNCFTCHKVCLETLHHCLLQRDTHFQGQHIALLQMCSEVCELSAKMMVSGIQFHRQACVLSFELCEATAEACERYQEDPAMLKCAEICRMCSDSCRGMSGTAVHVQGARSGEAARMQ